MPFCGFFGAEEVDSDIEDQQDFQRSTSVVETKKITTAVRTRPVRTTEDAPVPAPEALQALMAGNKRFAEGMGPLVRTPIGAKGRAALVDKGQRPSAIILGCADSRCALDTIFDAQPGDIFTLRNAGNALVQAEKSVIGSMEYAVSALQSKLILVLGHTKCGAIAGATKVALEKRQNPMQPAKANPSALEVLLDALSPVADATAAQLPPGTDEAAIAAAAVKTNVLTSMGNILQYSQIIRDAVQSGDVEVHGGIYDLVTGKVEFLGKHPKQFAAGTRLVQGAMGA